MQARRMLDARYGTAAATNLQVWAVVLGNKGAVALAQHGDLLLDVFDLVLRLLQVYYLDGNHLLCAIIDALEHLAERALADPLQLGEQLLRVGSGILVGMGGQAGGIKDKYESGGKGCRFKEIKEKGMSRGKQETPARRHSYRKH